MIKYKVYNNKYMDIWNLFVDDSAEATIFHSQKFLGYHIDRDFSNHSLMFYKNNKLIGLFTASEVNTKNNEKILFSHPGASFGGIVQQNYSLSDTLEMVSLIEEYGRDNHFHQITLVPTPSIYRTNHDDTLIYALKLKQYHEIERYYSSVIPIQNDIDMQLKSIYKNKGRTSKYYEMIISDNSLTIEWSNDFEAFYPILVENKKKYQCTPTHSLEEIISLNTLMPNHIQLLIIKKDGAVIGGNLIFIANPNVAIIFYNMIDYKYVDLQIAVIQVVESIRWAYSKKFKYIDFGVSHETGDDNYLSPKMSLIKFKEEFGAFGSTRTVLNKKL